MADARTTLNVAPRADFGSRTSRRMRREGLVPGVVYSGGSEATAFQVSERDVRGVIAEGAALFDLSIDGGKARPVVVKEQQLHPVKGTLRHIDLQEVKLDEAIQAEVMIELEGVEDAPGVKAGGRPRARHPRDHVEALPTDIPDKIVVDVSAMEINDTLQLSAITAPNGVTFVVDDPRGAHHRHPLPAARRRGRAGGRGGDRAGRRVRGAATSAGDGDSAATPRASSALCARWPLRPSHGERRRPASSSSASVTPGPSTPATATTSASTSARELARRWDLGKARSKYKGELWEGRTGPGRPARRDPPAADLHERGRRLGRPRPRRPQGRPRPDRRPPRRDRHPLRRDPRPRGRRPGRPQRPQVASNAASARPTSGASASASAAPTRPTPRSSPPGSSASSASPPPRSKPWSTRRPRDRTPGRAPASP